jgi:sialate O-acetylesterase
VAVRYCFHNFQIGNLGNTRGLPLVPFRTDNWDK